MFNMRINKDIIHDRHEIDSLIEAARLHPTESIIQKLIDLGLDYRGNYVGIAESAYIWRLAVAA